MNVAWPLGLTVTVSRLAPKPDTLRLQAIIAQPAHSTSQQALSKAPYLCEGDMHAPHYVLDDMVIALKLADTPQ